MRNAKTIKPEGYQSENTNNTPIIISVKASPKLPNKAKGLLPTLVRMKTVQRVASSCTALMMRGTSLNIDGRIFLTMVLAEVTIALIPVICCIKGS